MKNIFVSMIAVLSVMLIFIAPSYGGVDEDVRELKKELSKIIKDILHLK